MSQCVGSAIEPNLLVVLAEAISHHFGLGMSTEYYDGQMNVPVGRTQQKGHRTDGPLLMILKAWQSSRSGIKLFMKAPL